MVAICVKVVAVRWKKDAIGQKCLHMTKSSDIWRKLVKKSVAVGREMVADVWKMVTNGQETAAHGQKICNISMIKKTWNHQMKMTSLKCIYTWTDNNWYSWGGNT